MVEKSKENLTFQAEVSKLLKMEILIPWLMIFHLEIKGY